MLFLHCQSEHPALSCVWWSMWDWSRSVGIFWDKKVDFLRILNTANMFKFFFVNLWLIFRKIHPFHWRRKWQPTSVFLPGEVHGQRSLASYSAWRHKESDTTQQHFSLFSSISYSNNLVSEEVVKVEKIKSKAGLCLVAQPLITRHLNHFCH